jgi:predicted glycogen debranching enzyme
MSYIQFDKSKVINLEYALSREIIRSNRAGSYSSTTIVGCNTRKYHGLLVCPIDNFGGERHVLLSTLDLTVIQNERSFNTGVRKYSGDHYLPKGHKYIDDFNIDSIPVMHYRVGDVLFTQERLLVHNEEQLLYKYTIVEASGPLVLQLRPFLAFRSIHSLTFANMYANTRAGLVKNGIAIRMYEGFPDLFMQFSSPVEFIPVPDWYCGVEYIEEKNRGYDYKEDLFTPGFFELRAKEGDEILFSASTREEKPLGFKKKFTVSAAKKVPRDNFLHSLENAAQQFVESRNGETLIIAGFPWFGAWGRDTFIALPGIALSRQKESFWEEVFDTQVARMSGGLFPNMGSKDDPAYNSVDAPLWFFWALGQYQKQTGNNPWKRYGKAMKEVLQAYKGGTRYGIGMRDNGLIYAGEDGKALTWMDAVVNGEPVTPRRGYAVEINALWFNALCYALDLAGKAGDRAFVEEYGYLPELIRESFISTFWDKSQNSLFDYVNDEEGTNRDTRPNMLIAVSMPFSPLSTEQMKGVLDRAAAGLLTPRGMRTLSPDNSNYRGVYNGGQEERDSAYHQGTAWPWLLGPFCEGWLKVYGGAGAGKVREIIYGFEDVMSEHGVSTVSEIYDGDPPHLPRGAVSQAWSVSELLRILNMLNKEYS